MLDSMVNNDSIIDGTALAAKVTTDVATKVAAPLVKVLLAGSTAAPSELVKCTVPE